jgi:hypothetical protein
MFFENAAMKKLADTQKSVSSRDVLKAAADDVDEELDTTLMYGSKRRSNSSLIFL